MKATAAFVAQAERLLADARDLTGTWDAPIAGPSAGDCVLGNLVRLGVLGHDMLPDCYGMELQPLASVRTLDETARALSASILERRPAATPRSDLPAQPISYVEWLTQSVMHSGPAPAFAAVDHTRSAPKPTTHGPAPRVVPVFGAEIDQSTLRGQRAPQ